MIDHSQTANKTIDRKTSASSGERRGRGTGGQCKKKENGGKEG